MANELVKRGYTNLDYFDVFFKQEIDLSKYLERFSTPEYKLKFSNLQPVTTTIVNLFEQSKIVTDVKQKSSQFTKYRVQENEKLEDISFRLYETVDFWWIVAIFNNIRNPFYDLPLTEEQIVRLSEILSIEENKYPKETYYKLIFADNEEKRELFVPKREFIPDIIWLFRQDRLERLKLKG